MKAGSNDNPRKSAHSVTITAKKVIQSAISIPEEVRVYEFAQKANLNLADVIKTLFNLGLMVTKNDFLDKDSIEI